MGATGAVVVLTDGPRTRRMKREGGIQVFGLETIRRLNDEAAAKEARRRSEVIRALERELTRRGCSLELGATVEDAADAITRHLQSVRSLEQP